MTNLAGYTFRSFGTLSSGLTSASFLLSFFPSFIRSLKHPNPLRSRQCSGGGHILKRSSVKVCEYLDSKPDSRILRVCKNRFTNIVSLPFDCITTRYNTYGSPNQIQNQIGVVCLVRHDTLPQYYWEKLPNFGSASQIPNQISWFVWFGMIHCWYVLTLCITQSKFPSSSGRMLWMRPCRPAQGSSQHQFQLGFKLCLGARSFRHSFQSHCTDTVSARLPGGLFFGDQLVH